MGDLVVKIDDASFQRKMHDLAVLTKRDVRDVFKQQSKLIFRNVINITPPSTGAKQGTAAKKAGEQQIEKDLRAIFIGVRLKNKRPERWPNVAAIHAERFAKKHGKRLTRGQRSAFYVDQAKLKVLRNALIKNVGKLASGWGAAFMKLGGVPAAWISRHGTGRGYAMIKLDGNDLSIHASNLTPNGSPSNELLRRVTAAIRQQELNLTRQIHIILNRRTRGV